MTLRLLVTLLFTILIFPVTVANAADARPANLDLPLKEEGEIAGAAYRIDIPENWNGGLLMYAHGYARAGTEPGFNEMMINAAASLGYAIAQSRYTGQGWAAREGILDTEALRRFFQSKYGDTYPTIIAGHSQGAIITYSSIERFPEAYDGAMPMCGAGVTALEFFEERVFGMRVLFDYLMPGLPGSAVEFPEGRETYAKVNVKARELIQKHPETAEMYRSMTTISTVEAIPGVIAFWSEILRELDERTGGNAFDNRDTIYFGGDDDAKLNREIERYEADPQSVEYMREWVTLTGEFSDPVLAIHTLVDDLIPPNYANAYDEKATARGNSDRYIHAWVDRSGHCNISPEEIQEALRRLTAWIEDGKRPPTGELRVE